jgi:uncharacterized protein GlcG (DUF336 family)
MALIIAQTAMEKCQEQGYRVSVTVVDRAGETKVLVRGDGSNPHTVENSRQGLHVEDHACPFRRVQQARERSG